MRVWVTRDKNKDGLTIGDVAIWSKGSKPVEQDDDWYDAANGKILYEDYSHRFKTLFGFTPRKGSCKQYELTLKEIEIC